MSRLKQGNSILKNLFEMLYKILFKIKIVTQEKDYLKFKIIEDYLKNSSMVSMAANEFTLML